MKIKPRNLSFERAFLALLIGSFLVTKHRKSQQNAIDRIKKDYLLYIEWLKKKQNGETLDNYLKKNGYYKIAIYGMGAVGIRLYEELRNSSVSVVYAIDRKPKYVYSELNVCSLSDEFKNVDAIIVTLQSDFKEIKKQLKQKISVPIISIRDVIFCQK